MIIEPAVAHQRHFDALRCVMARYLPAILVGTFIAPLASLFIPQLIAQSHAGQVTTLGLILNLDANDINSINGAGATTWKDLSGYGYDATLSSSGSGYTISNDTTNKAIAFSKIPSDRRFISICAGHVWHGN